MRYGKVEMEWMRNELPEPIPPSPPRAFNTASL